MTIQKNKTNLVKVEVTSYEEATFIDIREYYEKNGKLIPTRKGVTLPLSALKELKKAVSGLTI